jgi:predicted ATPase
MTTKKTLTGRQRCDQSFNANLRLLAVVDLASMHATEAFEGSLDSPVEDLIDHLLERDLKSHSSTAGLRKAAKDADEDTIEVLGELLYRRNLLGLAVQFATPVMTKLTEKSCSFSWGYYQTEWVYAESYDEAWKLGIEWAEKCKAEAKPATKHRSARKHEASHEAQ